MCAGYRKMETDAVFAVLRGSPGNAVSSIFQV
ncbi:hypothetical protein EPIR_3517 [Erwinia piriflorinigrans CFBP 5888]|uniref:Uncharacterized protein n=1 Tax=Erwinia piriflorinigrans CFBP 5888 TaxID=1161919 RepID=V5ZC74_9GAMM|nr:hypothetical protein EPIR_3517 [Erwinia piriflorinigrans CFBP 5888]